jgi:pimeloyl-ACP methyl ester carboxylesterase
MSPRRRPGKRILRSLLPILLILFVTFGGATAWIVYRITHPPQYGYLVTPEKFTQLSAKGVKATEENWPNRDDSSSRGWLLRGSEGAPAVIILHGYGADRSYYLNLGVKLNEQTNFTILWPDLRGHGQTPSVKASSLGANEGKDLQAAVKYLRSLKSPQGSQLVGNRVGIYGVGLGAYAALNATADGADAQGLVLDSVPAVPDEIIKSAIRQQLGVESRLVQSLAKVGLGIYLKGQFQNIPACTLASKISAREILLLAGEDSGPFRNSTEQLASCLRNRNHTEIQSSLPLTGYNLHPSTGEQEDSYDRRIIEFFDRTLHVPQ